MFSRENTKLLISFFLGASVATIFLQRQTVFTLGLSFLPSKGKVWNWCPQHVNQVVVLPTNKNYSKTEDLKILCAAVIETNSEKKGHEQMFQVIMKAQNANGEITFVERSQDQTLFRIDGQIFPSNQLQKILRLYL
ncbi:MAG: hypothetical protein ACXVCP_20250 [Bdellovibrio sp.]